MSMEDIAEDFRSGFVALIGRPNVGKSTLLNAFLGSKVSIVSPKPQTTRTRIHGIVNEPNAQLVLIDTPGFCKVRGPLTRAMRYLAGAAPGDADMTLVVAEVRGDSAEITEADREVLEAASRSPGKVILAINKIDLLPQKELLLPWMAAYAEAYDLAAVIPISARTGDGLDELRDELLSRLPKGPPLFPRDLHTDQAERFICAELVREQLLLQTQEEIPHSAAVTVETFEDGRDDHNGGGLVRIEARIYVERDSQKAIVIGRGGQQIKAIGQAARRRIEELVDSRVFLGLTVHVDKQWTQNERALRRYGLMPEAVQ